MLGGEESPRFQGPGRYLLDCQDCQNLTVRDIILRNPWSWTFVTWNCDRVLIDNVKICGSRMINDDALDLVNTQNATVRNCFFRTQDDSIAVKGLAKMPRPCENILIEDCEFWTDVANIFRIFKNIQVVGEQGSFRGLLYMLGDSPKHSVSRLRFENLTYFGRPVTQDSPCVQIGPHVDDVVFRN